MLVGRAQRVHASLEEGPEADGVGVSWAGPSEEDPSYRLLVECNQLAVRALQPYPTLPKAFKTVPLLLQWCQVHRLQADYSQLAMCALHSLSLVPV